MLTVVLSHSVSGRFFTQQQVTDNIATFTCQVWLPLAFLWVFLKIGSIFKEQKFTLAVALEKDVVQCGLTAGLVGTLEFTMRSCGSPGRTSPKSCAGEKGRAGRGRGRRQKPEPGVKTWAGVWPPLPARRLAPTASQFPRSRVHCWSNRLRGQHRCEIDSLFPPE